jgi:hypothetical protein
MTASRRTNQPRGVTVPQRLDGGRAPGKRVYLGGQRRQVPGGFRYALDTIAQFAVPEGDQTLAVVQAGPRLHSGRPQRAYGCELVIA